MKLWHIMCAHPDNSSFSLESPLSAGLIVKHEWPPNSPDFNHLTINVHGAMLQTFYKLNLKPKTILELKKCAAADTG